MSRLGLSVLIYFWLFVHLLLVNCCIAYKFRHDWTNGSIRTPLAQQIYRQQHNCTAKQYKVKLNNFGMGSDMHIYSQSMCNAMQYDGSVYLIGNWIWNDQKLCSSSAYNQQHQHPQPLDCYFGKQTSCSLLQETSEITWRDNFQLCRRFIQGETSRQEFRQASMEFLFARVSPDLVALAETEAAIILQGYDKSRGHSLITVHIRWGDKAIEMELVSLGRYIQAVKTLVRFHNLTSPHVFITTEDSEALNGFHHMAPKQWVLHNHSSKALFHGSEKNPPKAAKASQGQLGSSSLVTLLIGIIISLLLLLPLLLLL